MRKIELGKSGEYIPVIGIGTWGIKRFRSEEYYNSWINAIQIGINEGMTLIDTAEMYGNGQSEKIVGKAIKSFKREDLFIATKIFPHHYGYSGVKKAIDRSLKKLDIKTIDLIQLHWPNPLGLYKNTVKALEESVKDGKVRYIGVSNFTKNMCLKFRSLLKNNDLVSNQIQMSVVHQSGIRKQLEFSNKEKITLIAWSPLGHFGFRSAPASLNDIIEEISLNRNITWHQTALSWLTSQPNVIAIPKSITPSHIKSNAAAADIILTKDEIDRIYLAKKKIK
jgi:diketogulonate reductase-like aldo/keto reductase